MVVDDCDPAGLLWDGASQAYKEFMEEISRPPRVVHDKFGLIEK